MTKTLEDLGKLKRSLEVVIPLEEIQSEYKTVFSKFKTVKLRGFRPGKFPKGWLSKRFKEEMTHNATDHIIPKYFNQIVEEMKLRPATQAIVEDLTFDEKQPLQFKLFFEVAPDLDLPDFEKLKLEKPMLEVSSEEMEKKIQELKKADVTYQKKEEDSKAEEGDQILVDFQRTLGTETSEEKDQRFVLDEKILPEIKSQIMGMKVGESKEFSFTITKEYSHENVGETVQFKVTLNEVENPVLPELDENFYKRFEGSNNEEEFKAYVKKSIKREKETEKRFSNHDKLKEQLQTLYEDFDLPEKTLEEQEKSIEENLRQSKENKDGAALSDAEIEKSKSERLDEFKQQLRLEYILRQVSDSNEIIPEQEQIHQRFSMMASLNQSAPNDFIQTQSGQYFYQQIVRQVSDEAVLDFITKKVLGEEEVEAAE